MKRFAIAAALLSCVAACGHRKQEARPVESHGMTITSPAFTDNGQIPKQYGCSGAGISPPLTFGKVPGSAKSLTLIVEDPDAPGGTFTHWSVSYIPPATRGVTEGQAPAGVEGTNGYGKAGWGPPCPPNGEHRYVFRLLAIDTQGKVIAESRLTGRYHK